jgi:hypothetical protein
VPPQRAASASQANQTYIQRAETDAANWDQYLGGAADLLLCTTSKRAQQQQAHAIAVGQQVTAAVNTGVCYSCGLHTSSCTVEKRVPVQLLDMSCCPMIVVSCFRCPR